MHHKTLSQVKQFVSAGQAAQAAVDKLFEKCTCDGETLCKSCEAQYAAVPNRVRAERAVNALDEIQFEDLACLSDFQLRRASTLARAVLTFAECEEIKRDMRRNLEASKV